MKLKDLLKEVQQLGLSDSFSESAGPIPSSEKLTSVCNDPLPDFVRLLKDKIVDRRTGEKIWISQSMIKRFLKVVDGELCSMRFRATLVEGAEEKSGKAAMMGNRFQWLAFGLLDYNGKEPEPIITEKTGKIGADEKRIVKNAALAQGTLKRLGYEIIEGHRELRVKCIKGEWDLYTEKDGKKYILDVKYSGLIGDKWHEWGWPDNAEDFTDKVSHIIQAKQYLLLANLLGIEVDGFIFLVFDSRAEKEGQYKEYLLSVSEQGINEHKRLILNIVEEFLKWMDNDMFVTNPSFTKCKSCPISEICPNFRKYPETVKIEL